MTIATGRAAPVAAAAANRETYRALRAARHGSRNGSPEATPRTTQNTRTATGRSRAAKTTTEQNAPAGHFHAPSLTIGGGREAPWSLR